MTKQMGNVRSDDTCGLKVDGLEFMVLDQAKDQVTPVIPKAGDKSSRGWAHLMTARLLCPRSMRDDFDFDKATAPRGAVDPE